MEFKDDPKFSFIVPVYDVPQDVFKRCLMSIVDQDYPNLEVIVIANGGDKNAYDIALEFAKDRKDWTVIFTNEKGACNARNMGFKASTGEIVSFFNSDYIAKPGMVRMWVDALLKNPDCGFAYGAYEYAAAQRDVYWSKPFDVYQLEVANYIDCGFPLWRKHVQEWDTEVKSLQDWDFWLRVVKSGVKGFYIPREISFVAAYPRLKGLSHDSTDHWLERVEFVKNKNGIPLRDVCVTSFGAANHGVEIAKMINADFRDDTLHKPHDYKALYLIGWYMKPGEERNPHSEALIRFQNSKRIVHFVGADIYWLRKFSSEQIRGFAGALKLSTDAILCENELAKEELKGFGIDADIVPIAPYSEYEVKPLPEDFKVALYLTDRSDFDKYLQRHTLSIVKAMPDVKFVGYGDAYLNDFKASNFEHRGSLSRKDWESLVYECSAYLRIVKHDTRPMATDEFLMSGRSVITNIPNPMVNYIDTSGTMPFDSWDKFSPGFSALRWPDTKANIVREIRKVRDNPKVDLEAIARLKEYLSKDKYRETLKSYFTAAPKLEVLSA